MQDYGAFCYLDVQKTGSTFICSLLRASSHTPALMSNKHMPLRAGRKSNKRRSDAGHFRDGTFYFNSVRNPLAYYASLYNYGCDNRGAIYSKLKISGKSELYDGTKEGFYAWCDLITNSENAHLLGSEFARLCFSGIGFLTYRFLKLSVASPRQHLDKLHSVEEAIILYGSHNICQYTIKNDTLDDDLRFLIDNHLSEYLDRDKALRFLNRKRINSSKSKAANSNMLMGYSNLELILEKERLIFTKFYPDVI